MERIGFCLALILSGASLSAAEIHDAASAGNAEKVRGLLRADPSQAQARSSAEQSESTPLHLAAAGGHLGVVEALVAAQADVNAKDKDGKTPLHLAVQGPTERRQAGRQLAAARLLLRSKADVNGQDNAGATPLHLAANAGDVEIVQLLLANETNAALQDKDGRTALQIALEKPGASSQRIADLLADKSGVAATPGPELKLLDGTILFGVPVSFNDVGVVIRQRAGGYSERYPWIRLTQESLKELLKNPQAAPYVEPFIEIPLEEKRKARQKEIVIRPVETRIERPAGGGLFGALTAPAGLLILAALFAANLFAAYEIAIFKNQAPALVCALSVFLPVLGPVLFLALPARAEAGSGGAAELAGAGAPGPAEQPAGSMTSKLKGKLTSPFQARASGGLTLASQQKGAEAAAKGPMVYKRGETTFNRRFFETQLSGFFRMVPLEAEKDLVLVIRTPRAEYVAKRISRISANEMYLQVQKGGAAEVPVTFSEIVEVQVRHKDAKP